MVGSETTSSNAPTAGTTISTYEPTSSATTYEPTTMSSVATTEPTPVSTMESTTTLTTLSPTISKNIIGTAPPVAPPVIPSPTVIEIQIQYGITSDCGVTAEDVLMGNDGITIQDGLIVATETLLIEILNSTYPSGEDDGGGGGVVPTPAPTSTEEDVTTTESPTFAITEEGTMAATASPTAPATEGAVTASPTMPATEGVVSASPTVAVTDGAVTTSPTAAVTEGSATASPTLSVAEGAVTASPTLSVAEVSVTTIPTVADGVVGTPSPSSAVSSGSTTVIPASTPPPSTASSPAPTGSLQMRNANIHSKFVGARVRVNKLASGPLSRRSLLSMLQEDESPSLFRLHNNRSRREHQHQYHQRRSRTMVYYTPENSVVINDITDVTDDTCPSELTCMKVDSTLYVTLEEGLDAEEVEIQSVVQNGFEASFQDFSFFNVSSILLVHRIGT